MTDNTSEDISWRAKSSAIYRAITFRPLYAIAVLIFGVFAALFEGVGMSFLLPIIELAQGQINPQDASGILGAFISIYQMIGVPFTFGYLVVGVALVMVVRYTLSFIVGWLRVSIETYYIQHLQTRGFESALDARITYFDQEGSDDILNAIVTQSEYAGRVIRRIIILIERFLMALMYMSVAFYFAPMIMIYTAIIIGFIILLYRYVLKGGYSLGNQLADANEEIQTTAQAGTQGIRDVKLFNLNQELRSQFHDAVTRFTESRISVYRNQEAIKSFYELTIAVTLFILLFVALEIFELSFSRLGVFLFAMFRLGPRVSSLNRIFYQLESELPHLVRTQQFIDDLAQSKEQNQSERSVPDSIDIITFEDVTFTYKESGENVLQDVTFSFSPGEFIAFVGPSGAGKSTIASLLSRMYEPDSGAIFVNGTQLSEFLIKEWRPNISVVRQDPHIFNETLRWNLTIGNREARQDEIEKVCEIAQVTEFLDELENGYETELGDNGIQLSGGQRQRVAIARALLKDAKLLIFDEATSDLDTNLEKQVHKNIESMSNDYAILIIAHRLSTVVNADKIYTIEDGQIIETGTHDMLIENEQVYAELYGMQNGVSEDN